MKALAGYYLLGKASVQLYYIVVLVQLIILMPLFIRIMRKKTGLIFLLLCTLGYIIVMLPYLLKMGSFPKYYSTIFLAWVSYYCFGLYKAKNKTKGNKNISFLMIILACGLSLIEGWIIHKVTNDYYMPLSQIKMSSFLLGMSVSGYVIDKAMNGESKAPKWMVELGNSSFGIYLIHMFVVDALRIVFDRISLENYIMCLQIYQLIQITLTVGISYIIIKITKKIVGEKNAKIYLGF